LGAQPLPAGTSVTGVRDRAGQQTARRHQERVPFSRPDPGARRRPEDDNTKTDQNSLNERCPLMFWNNDRAKPVVMTLEYLAREVAGWVPNREMAIKAPILALEFGKYCTARCGKVWLFRNPLESLGLSVAEPDRALQLFLQGMVGRVGKTPQRICLTISPELRNQVTPPTEYCFTDQREPYYLPIRNVPIEDVILEAFRFAVWANPEDGSGVVVHFGERSAWAFGVECGFAIPDSTTVIADPHYQHRLRRMLERLNKLIFKKTGMEVGLDSLMAMETFFEQVDWEGKPEADKEYRAEKTKILLELIDRFPEGLKAMARQKAFWCLVQGDHWKRVHGFF